MQKINKGLSFWMLVALVTGNMIGSGIFLLPASLASFGTISILSWVFTAVGAILLALVFAKLSTLIPKSGGPYTYCREGFGDFIGFQVAYNYWIAAWVGNAAIVTGFVGYMGFFWPALQEDYSLSFLVKVATIWLLTAINILGIRNAGIVQVVTMVLKIMPLLLISILGFSFISMDNLANFNVSGHSNFTALTGAATLTLWSFIGLESATVPAEKANNPKYVAPATMVGTLIAAFIYITSTVVIMGMIPLADLAQSSAPYADAANQIFSAIGHYFSPGSGVQIGNWGGALIAIGAMISCFGALNGWILLQGQVPQAAARDGLFPAMFKQESSTGTPVVGLVISSVLITLLLALTLNQSLVKQFTFIILLATLASLIGYFMTCFAELAIFIKMREKFQAKRFVKSSIIAVLAGIYAFWMIMGSGVDTVFYGALLFFSSIPVYVWIQWRSA